MDQQIVIEGDNQAKLPRQPWSKRKKTIVWLVVSIVVLIAVLVVVILINKNRNQATNGQATTEPTTVAETPIDTRVKSPLDGTLYESNLATRHPLAVMIENHPDARPQSGLADASLVYEAITEGGITRFMAVFSPKDVAEVGPIRSARLYFMDWLKEYDAYYAHAGGSEDALASISKYGVKDIPHSNTYYWRDSKGRSIASEHTLYSSTEKLYAYAESEGYDINTSDFSAMTFKDDLAAPSPTPNVDINFSSASYTVRWVFDLGTNCYKRFMAGVEHRDRNTGTQINVKNIVIQRVNRTYKAQSSGKQNWVYSNIGTGTAWVLQDGKVIEATWKKASLTDRTKYYDSTGAEIKFNVGRTWYEIIPSDIAPVFN